MGIDLKRRTRTTRERLSNIRTYSEIKELQMSITIFPNLEIQFEGKSYFLTFATETMQVLKSQGLREVITCRIAQSEPLRFYAGMTVRNPKDPIADDYFPHAKVALKRALKALWYDQTEGVEGIDDVKHHCFSCMYSRFRYDMLQAKTKLDKEAKQEKRSEPDYILSPDKIAAIKNDIEHCDVCQSVHPEALLLIMKELDKSENDFIKDMHLDEAELRRIFRQEIANLFK
jgi:hypothetical protein